MNLNYVVKDEVVRQDVVSHGERHSMCIFSEETSSYSNLSTSVFESALLTAGRSLPKLQHVMPSRSLFVAVCAFVWLMFK